MLLRNGYAKQPCVPVMLLKKRLSFRVLLLRNGYAKHPWVPFLLLRNGYAKHPYLSFLLLRNESSQALFVVFFYVVQNLLVYLVVLLSSGTWNYSSVWQYVTDHMGCLEFEFYSWFCNISLCYMFLFIELRSYSNEYMHIMIYCNSYCLNFYFLVYSNMARGKRLCMISIEAENEQKHNEAQSQ